MPPQRLGTLDEPLKVSDDILIRWCGMTKTLLTPFLGILHMVTDKASVGKHRGIRDSLHPPKGRAQPHGLLLVENLWMKVVLCHSFTFHGANPLAARPSKPRTASGRRFSMYDTERLMLRNALRRPKWSVHLAARSSDAFGFRHIAPRSPRASSTRREPVHLRAPLQRDCHGQVLDRSLGSFTSSG